MDKKGEMTALTLMFLPLCYAVINIMIQLKIIDLLYLIVVFVVFLKYYITKKA